MDKKLRVLAIEDSEDDALRLAPELRRHGYDPVFERVERADALAEALDGAQWDIVLADYDLPAFSGMEALRIVREREKDLPVIIVSGEAGEEIALAAMKAGASDFILRDSFGRLPLAIERAMEEASLRRDRKRLEEELRQAQKMEAIGLLAGGIAHDFNNILTAITGYGSLLQSLMDDADPLRVYVKQILAASGKAAALTQSLLAFSRKRGLNVRPLNVNAVIENISNLLSRIIGEDIELKADLADSPLNVMADKGQLEQVLMNLATNSRDAMPEGGRFTISTDLVEVDDTCGDITACAPSGPFVLISVGDTGAGMDEETRQRIFEPFFTTKDPDKGTGLGLSIVSAIVKQHRGFVEVESEPGRGSVFRLFLPRVEQEMERKEGRLQEDFARGGVETILVAEDSEAVRELIKDVLEKAGYRVIPAEDGEDALMRFREVPEEVDLLLLDVVLPRKNGVKVFEELKTERHVLKALFMSGYVSDSEARREISAKGYALLSKPLSMEDLLKKVREVLDE